MLTMRVLWIAMLGAAVGVADDESARQILATQCVSCHGAAKLGGLDLRARASMLAGGGRGAAVIPGQADASLLYQAVLRKGPLTMPPGKQGLSEADVATLKAWMDRKRGQVERSIDLGAIVLVVVPEIEAPRHTG